MAIIQTGCAPWAEAILASTKNGFLDSAYSIKVYLKAHWKEFRPGGLTRPLVSCHSPEIIQARSAPGEMMLVSKEINTVKPFRVVMITGAYFPEISGAGLQCRSLIGAAADERLCFSVITTACNPKLPFRDLVDGVPVYRLPVSGKSLAARALSWIPRLAYILLRVLPGAHLVHLHGFSRKSYLFVSLARILRKRIIIKMSSLGEDDPESVFRSGGARAFFYRLANRYIAPSQALAESYRRSGLPAEKLFELTNGVDTVRFSPAEESEKLALRRALGLPEDQVLVLFAGHFSEEKRPHLLALVWSELKVENVGLVLIGSAAPGSFEVSGRVVEEVQRLRKAGGPGALVIAGLTRRPEDYFRAADIFVLPSVREGLPNALLEAMASGLACVAVKLPGSTETLLGNRERAGGCGILFEADDRGALGEALERLARDRGLRQELGRMARQRVLESCSLEKVARRYRDFVFQICRRKSSSPELLSSR